jgi:hypothetical protein
VVLDGLRVNQLSLARRLSGEVALTEPRLLLKGRGPGRQGNELLELDLALPPSPLALRPAPGPDGKLPLLLYRPPAFAAAVHVAQQAPAALQQQQGGGRQHKHQHQQGQAAAGSGDGEGAEGVAAAAVGLMSADADVMAGLDAGSHVDAAQRVSHVLLRRGDLHFSSTVSAQGCSNSYGPCRLSSGPADVQQHHATAAT